MGGGAKAAIIGACVGAALYVAISLLPKDMKSADGRPLEQHVAHYAFACVRDVEDSAAALAKEGDLDAAKALVKQKVASDECVYLEANQLVYVEDRNAGGFVKVRTPGNPNAYWMPAASLEP